MYSPASEWSTVKARRLHRGQQRVAAALVALALFAFVRVVVERGDHRALHGRRHHHPRVFAHREQFGDQRAVAGDEAGPVAGQRGGLGQRVNGQQAGVVTVADRGVQQRNGFGIPAQAEVALVGRDDRTAFAGPPDDLAKVVGAEHGTGRVARRVEVDQCR